MPSSKISALPSKATPVAADTTVIVDSIGTTNKKITLDSMPISSAVSTALSAKEAVANKAVNLTTPDNIKYPSTLAVSTALALKQNNLGFTPENVVNKATNLITPNNTKYPTTLAVSTALDLKQNLIGYTPEDQGNKVSNILDNLDNTRYPTTRAVYDLVTYNAPYYHIKDIRFNGCGPGLSGETPILFYPRTRFLEKNGSLVVHSIVCRREPGNDKIFFRLRISNSDDYATSTIIATCQIGTSDRISTMQRTFTNDGSRLYGVEFAYSLNTDMIQHSLYDQVEFNWDTNYYFWVTVEIPDSSDSCEIGGIKIGV